MSSTSVVCISEKRRVRCRYDDDYTASTSDPVTVALSEVCRFKAGNFDPMKPLYDLLVEMLPCDNKVRGRAVRPFLLCVFIFNVFFCIRFFRQDRLACHAPLSSLMKQCSIADGSFDLDSALRLLCLALSSSTVIVHPWLARPLVNRLLEIVMDFSESLPHIHHTARDGAANGGDGAGPTNMLCLFGQSARVRCKKGVAVHCAEWAFLCPQPPSLRTTRHAVVVSALCVLSQLTAPCDDVKVLLCDRVDVIRATVRLIGMHAVEYHAVCHGALFFVLSMLFDVSSSCVGLVALLVENGLLATLMKACDATRPHNTRITALAVLKHLIDVYPENRQRAAEDTDVVQMLFRMLRKPEESSLHHAAVLTLASFCCAHGCTNDALTGVLLSEAVSVLLGVFRGVIGEALGIAVTDVISLIVRQQNATIQVAIGAAAFPVLARMLSSMVDVGLIHIGVFLSLCDRNVVNTVIAIDMFVGILTAARPCDGGPSLFARSGALRLLKIVSELDNYDALKTMMDTQRSAIIRELQRAAHPSSCFETFIRQVAAHILQATAVGHRLIEGTLCILRELPVFRAFHSASDSCPICQYGNDDIMPAGFNDLGVVYSVCCSKGFHVCCITPWILSRPAGLDTCPLCRHGFTADISKKWATLPSSAS